MSSVVIGCRVAVPRSHWSAVPTPLFDNISQLFGDSFSVSQQPPICELPSHYSMDRMGLIWSWCYRILQTSRSCCVMLVLQMPSMSAGSSDLSMVGVSVANANFIYVSILLWQRQNK